MRKIVEGEYPERPQGPEAVWFMDGLWVMLEQYWSPKLNLRPAVKGVLESLNWGLVTWEPLPLSVGSNSLVDSDDNLTFTMSHHPCAFSHIVADLCSHVQYP